MEIPGNGIYVVQGEMNIILTAMRRGVRWSSHNHQDEENDILIRSFSDLKDVLNQINDLRDMDPSHFLGPFLEIIRSEETTAPVTNLALSSIMKFLSYGLIDPNSKSIAVTVDNIADAVAHARFLGTDNASDGVVLMNILQVLRTLMLSPLGKLLTNDSVCEIMLSCFRICFEVRLNELLRKCAENCLKDMVQLLFTRLSTFSEDQKKYFLLKKLKMHSSTIEPGKTKRKTKAQRKKSEEKSSSKSQIKIDEIPSRKSSATEASPLLTAEKNSAVIMQSSISQEELSSIVDSVQALPTTPVGETPVSTPMEPSLDNHERLDVEKCDVNTDTVNGFVIRIEDSDTQSVDTLGPPAEVNCNDISGDEKPLDEETKSEESRPDVLPKSDILVENEPVPLTKGGESVSEDDGYHGDNPSSEDVTLHDTPSLEIAPDSQEWVNQQGVRFTSDDKEGTGNVLVPYGLVSVQELFRFLVSLCNPFDKQNTDPMVLIGLNLLTVALEVGADSIAKFSSLLNLVKDDLCRNLFSLLSSERLSIFAADLQVSFLLFESLRTHLKFQFERFLSRLTEIIVSDSSRISHDQKEIALECVVQLWRIRGLVTELYLNYDCDLYCPNLYEELTNLLSKNAYPVAGVYNIHLLSLDALLTVIDSIESHCHNRILNERQHAIPDNKVSEDPKDQILDPTKNYLLKTGTRQKISVNIPSHEQLMAIKRKKKLLATGTEHFNTKPKKGVQFLQEHHLLSSPLDPQEVATFLRENPHLDKKMIGEFISNRSNLPVLECFVKSFDFTEMRIDEALRLYLESFRLPGESPLISLVMEHFADHWHKCNGEPFSNSDAAFTLAYAVIMLNVDQHNHNVKKQNNPMRPEDFKRNLKNVNGGQDFDQDMLDDIYTSIKSEEIVMPAEQTGLVKENYLWKVLLRRGASRDGIYIHAPSGLLDHDLFSLIWGPTVAALSFLFDKTNDAAIYKKAISGFRKCAMISAHYGMSSDFDNLIVSLCKFTTLISSPESPDNLTISFGSNIKARLAAKTVFNLAHRHGDIIRDSWRNILECILQLYRCKLLPKILVEAEDFIEPSGKISLVREQIQLNPKPETGLFSSLYSYIALAAETNTQKGPSPEDQEAIRNAHNFIRECHLEQLITESKFLRLDSLQHFVKALVRASYGPEGHVSLGSSYSEDTAVFFLELLLKVVIQNRDRVGTMWSNVREHIYTLLMGAAACDHHFLVERSVVGLLRLAIRLMRREEMSPVVLQSLRMLLLLKGTTLSRVARQVSAGMYELLKTSAANIHSATDWAIIFTLLECVGAGAPPPRVVGKPVHINDSGARSEGELMADSGIGNERGYTSDSELSKVGSQPLSPTSSPDVPLNTPTGWILVGREGEIQPVTLGGRVPPPDLSLGERELSSHNPYAMVKCCESLAFLVRDVAHITPYNFENCVHCLRVFVEACADANERKNMRKIRDVNRGVRKKSGTGRRTREDHARARSPTGSAYDADESDPEEVPSGYQQVCIQLLDLIYTLHTRTAQIYRWWAEESAEPEHVSLWLHGWCPLLQGIARLCSHSKRQVRMSAITYLQRALLIQDLQTLSGAEWESCFTQVLFPLLNRLLEPFSLQHDGFEETRIRAATVLSKVFLHHLTPLLSLCSFTQLWLTILDFMDKYMHVDNSDLLFEAIPESLKNMLLVMDSANVFAGADGHNEIWTVTWDRINAFLPNLQSELFRTHPAVDMGSKESVEEIPVAENITETEEGVKLSSSPVQTPSPPVISPMPPSRSDDLVDPTSTLPASMPSLVTPQNWQPPAPIFPHIGQLLSTPIGPPVNQNAASVSLPVYSGFTNAVQKSDAPSAQFFYQDLNCSFEMFQPQNALPPVNQVPVQAPGNSSLLFAPGFMEGPSMSQLPVLSPPEPPS